jgi:protein tyrosine/serine phosphatase
MRAGLLYRADEPVRLTAEGRAAIDALGLTAVIDLRQKAQVDRGHLFADAGVTHHIQMVDRVLDVDNPPPRFEGAVDIADLYEDMVERGGEQLVQSVEIIAEHVASGPVLVHCVAGKDRTGLVVAVVQAAIGVPLHAVVEEYALSDEPTRRRRAMMIADPRPGDPPVDRSPELLWTAPAEAMALYTRRIVERHGSLTAWPAALGVPAATVERLREHLVAEQP